VINNGSCSDLISVCEMFTSSLSLTSAIFLPILQISPISPDVFRLLISPEFFRSKSMLTDIFQYFQLSFFPDTQQYIPQKDICTIDFHNHQDDFIILIMKKLCFYICTDYKKIDFKLHNIKILNSIPMYLLILFHSDSFSVILFPCIFLFYFTQTLLQLSNLVIQFVQVLKFQTCTCTLDNSIVVKIAFHRL
jgi:hypothetical protein